MTDQPLKPPPGVVTRRQFLYLSGGTIAAVTAGGLLAACSSAVTSAPNASPTAAPTAAGTAAASAAACPTQIPSTAAVGGPFNLFCWEGFDGKGVPIWDAWWGKNNIQLNVKYISNENLVALMKSPSGKDWDASSLNQGDVPNGWNEGICTPITDQDVPSLAKMYPFFRDGDFWKICEGTYAAVPWTFGTIAVNIRTDKISADLLSSYEGLFDPKLKGRVGAFDDPLNMVATAAIATGLDPGKLTREQLNGPVKDWLVRLRPQLRALQTSIGDQSNVLASGDVWAEMIGMPVWVPTLKAQGIPVAFVTPKEGALGYADSIFIPPTAPHRQNAIAWINAMMEGDTAKAINESNFQLSSNPDVNATLSQDVISYYSKDIQQYLGQMKFNRSYFDTSGPYATMEEWAKVWSDTKAAV
jgi:spermidine/putrescine transport system substrate-binding protein